MTGADVQARAEQAMQRMIEDARRLSITNMIDAGLDDDEIDDMLAFMDTRNEEVLREGRAQLARQLDSLQRVNGRSLPGWLPTNRESATPGGLMECDEARRTQSE